jgi:Arm DNA-binding domain
MLSDRQVGALKPGKDKMLSNGEGLYIRVSPAGSKTFLYRSRTGGRARYIPAPQPKRSTRSCSMNSCIMPIPGLCRASHGFP